MPEDHHQEILKNYKKFILFPIFFQYYIESDASNSSPVSVAYGARSKIPILRLVSFTLNCHRVLQLMGDDPSSTRRVLFEIRRGDIIVLLSHPLLERNFLFGILIFRYLSLSFGWYSRNARSFNRVRWKEFPCTTTDSILLVCHHITAAWRNPEKCRPIFHFG